MPEPLSLAVLGCGSRGRTYAKIAASFGDRYRIVAAADPVAVRREAVAALGDSVAVFDSAETLFAAGKLADVLVIATQDSQHFDHVMQALEAGYDVLLEKPAAESLERCEAIDRRARELGRRVALCFVLRYTPFYSTVKQVLDSGRLGRVISMRSHEGVEPFHQAHSFVRGHWRSSRGSTPMIVAKCSHDADLICWLGGSAAASISSYGDRSWFRGENAPEGAPARCSDGCPVAEDCLYDAHRYLGDKRRWLGMVMDGADEADDDTVLGFLRTSPWGRCVYRCDNDVVDHQVIACELENGITVTHTMTAFDYGRAIEIYGTKASLKGGLPYHEAGAPELWLRDHEHGTIEPVEIHKPADEGYAGHGGGDHGIVDALDRLFQGPDALPPGLDGLAGHRLAFLSETSRLNQCPAHPGEGTR
ncbi:Gfo/Idh/MocA family protein [Luteolibacter marinus]|uniref:Gfo/Idh/MocA family protein n=1 Tax=Luteolibacter marinus TaxID=2776705 RepID=UPI001867E35A|nr:Gfo/Idh/MocA family oxidoreductase [Luteolibacter marinus]